MDTIPVFYHEHQNAQVSGVLSPSAAKPAKAVESWLERGLPVSLHAFGAVARELFYTVHDRDFVDGVLAGRIANGFGNTSSAVAASLGWTTGSLLAAARHAVRHGGAACSPTSGFHHAHFAQARGFCTFNGLAVTAKALLDERLVDRVGILDLDMHFGDGTEDILARRRLAGRVEHYTFGRAVEQGLANDPESAEEWLKALPDIVDGLARAGCDVVLYQAGADPHEDDPLGGVMTTDQLRRRDEIVFGTLSELRLPVAWNLAGGYQTPLRKVLDLHDATMIACAANFLSLRATPGVRRP